MEEGQRLLATHLVIIVFIPFPPSSPLSFSLSTSSSPGLQRPALPISYNRSPCSFPMDASSLDGWSAPSLPCPGFRPISHGRPSLLQLDALPCTAMALSPQVASHCSTSSHGRLQLHHGELALPLLQQQQPCPTTSSIPFGAL